MAANPRIRPTSDDSLAAVVPQAGVVTPNVNAVVLVDGNGNVIQATDVGGGYATLDITGGGGGGGGDATAANQVLEIAQLTAINAGVPTALGQTTMAGSMAVVIASDQSAVPVSGTLTVTGVATAANQATEIASLASIDAGMPAALGQTTMAASLPVVLASDQSAVPFAGNVAHDAVDSGNPVKVGVQARTTLPTAVADGDRVNLIGDKFGRLVTLGSIPELNGDQTTTITASTTETTIVTADAANKLHIHCLILSNSGATGAEVTIRDGVAGTVRTYVMVPAGDTRGFALPESASFKQAAVNTAWTAQCSASTSSMRITAKFTRATS